MRRHYKLTNESPTFIDKVEAVNICNNRLIIPQVRWQSYGYTGPDTLSESYGDWDGVTATTPLDPSKLFVLIEYASGSDYSEGLVEVSNYNVMLETIAAQEQHHGVAMERGKDYLEYSGGHGTFALAVRVDAIGPDLLEQITSLSDYPLLDESDHSQREIDAQGESWDSWGRSDFKRELEKQVVCWLEATLGDQDGDYEQSEWDLINWVKDGEWVDTIDARVDQWAWDLMEVTNTYWENEQGSDCYLDVERVASGVWNRLADHAGDWTKGKQAEVRKEVEESVIRGWEQAYWDGFKIA